MSRKQGDDDGSLELLLDTICNTFGGVLFISILVVLLLNASSKEAATTPPSEVQADLLDAQVRLSQSKGELQKLLTAVQAQNQVADKIIDPVLRDLVRNSSRLQADAAQTQKKLKGVDQITKDQIDINEKTEKILEHQQALKNAKGSLQGIEAKLEREIESRTQAAKLPKGRATEKAEIPMFLKAGRLCTYLQRDGNTLTENLAEIVKKQDEDNRTYIEPKPGTGVLIDVDGNHANIDARLGDFDASQHYLAVFVWPDSFEHFAVLKDRMVAAEFKYRLVPFQGDQKIFFGPMDEAIEVQ